MYSAQEISTAVKSVANGFRPIADSISLDVSEVTEIDVLLTYALTARSLDEASAAVERVLELDSENEVANAAFTWFLGVRDSAERLEQAKDTEPCENESKEAPAATADESPAEELFSSELFGEGPAGTTAADTVKDEGVSGDNSGFETELPYAFQQVVEPLIASKEQDDDTSAETAAKDKREEAEQTEAEAADQAEREEAEAAAKAEREEAEREEAEAAAKAEREEAEREEAEAAAKAEREETERKEAEAAAKAEREEAEREEAEAAAKAEREEAEREEAEAAAKAEREETERKEAEAAAKAEREEAEQEEAEAAAKAEREETERKEAEAAAKAEREETERKEAEAAAKAEREEDERAEAEAAAQAERAEAEAAAKAEQEEAERAEAVKQEQEDEVVVAEAVELADEVHEAATAPSSASSIVIEPAKAGEKLTILTVDDSPTIRKLLAMTLEREGFDVVQAQDGVEALVKMSECNPAMILSDINMPRLDGYKLCKFVKKHAKTKHIPVIMLSGKDGVFDKLRGRMSGCDGYLTKPFESKDLLEKIRSFIGTTV